MRDRLMVLVIGVTALAACSAADSMAPKATVYFTLDAPLCSSRVPIQFSIDSAPVGSETLTVNINNDARHVSPGFDVAAGTHILSATTGWGYVFPDKIATLVAGQAFTDSLPMYCS